MNINQHRCSKNGANELHDVNETWTVGEPKERPIEVIKRWCSIRIIWAEK